MAGSEGRREVNGIAGPGCCYGVSARAEQHVRLAIAVDVQHLQHFGAEDGRLRELPMAVPSITKPEPE